MPSSRIATRTFKLSRDKQFVEKTTDAVGIYLNPPNTFFGQFAEPALHQIQPRRTGGDGVESAH